jgi:tetratricopeptide (TPR) repeat protein
MSERNVERPAKSIHIDEIRGMQGPGTLTWHPVRATLGIHAFGTNAYTADEPGVDVVEPHDEAPDEGESLEDAHEELYFVARGRAVFTIDGDQIDAPAGTYVFVPDPASRRHAVAAEAGTTVLSFGGPPRFEPSAWEWSFRAAALRQEGDAGGAREALEDGLAKHPDHAGVRYEFACWEATQGSPEAAIERLREAIERDAEAATYARDDEDFASLREREDFRALVSD